MKIRFIINPFSGRNARRPWLERHIRDFIAGQRINANIVTTNAPGHATALARTALAEGCQRIVAVGGDGTMNEIAQALLHSPAALALIPCGSGNGLARHLQIPRELDAALEVAASDDSLLAPIDTGTANGFPFVNAMGCGFDAEVSQRFNRLTRRGLPAYARTGFAAFRRRRTERIQIRDGARRFDADVLLVAIANSDEYGNGAKISPGARVDDGKLDLVLVRPVTTLAALPLIVRLFTNQLRSSPSTLHLRGSRFTLVRSAPGLIHTDGETHMTGAEIEICVRPHSLRMIVPAGCTVSLESFLHVPTALTAVNQ